MARKVGFAAASLGASRRLLSSNAHVPLDEIAGAESIGRWYGSRLPREDASIPRGQPVGEIVQCGEGGPHGAVRRSCRHWRLRPPVLTPSDFFFTGFATSVSRRLSTRLEPDSHQHCPSLLSRLRRSPL